MENWSRNRWSREIMDSSSNRNLRLYKHIKQDYRIEPYLYINVAKYRIVISRLRLSSHHLGIEVGSYARPVIPMEKRLCNECTGRTEDEVHFLNERNKYDKLRKGLFDSLLANMTN